MSKIISALKTIRNNWKKSTFALCAVSYGVNYGNEKYKTEQLMRGYCLEALEYGHVPLLREEKPKHVTIILNPAAKRRKAKALFEKYCAPLLNLAGMTVSIVQTDQEGQARGLMEVMSGTDAVAIAGGDGTLSEAVTGLLRRPDSTEAASNYPIAILPLGRTNSVAASIFGKEKHEAQYLAEATMALIKGLKKQVDVMKIEPIEINTEVPNKPVYAVSQIEWGAYRDAHSRRDKYWLWGPLRSYVTYIFSWTKPEMTWDCQAELDFVAHCKGCSTCGGAWVQPQPNKHWWQAFIPKSIPSTPVTDYSKVHNPECGVHNITQISTLDLNISTSSSASSSNKGEQSLEPAALQVAIGPKDVGFIDFVSEGWRRAGGEIPQYTKTFNIRELKLIPTMNEPPQAEEVKERWLSIDQENFELKPMHITLQPRRINMFCPSSVQ